MIARPNIIVLITDQQRLPRHWPGGRAWVDELMPSDAELARTGLTFRKAFVATCMCSPSRASLFTGLYPSEHGVTLTLTAGDLWPDRRNAPAVMRRFARGMVQPEAARPRMARAFVRGLLRMDASGGDEPELDPETPNIAQLLRAAGYRTALKGKWHLTQPVASSGWSAADSERLDRDFAFGEWDPPDAGENVKPENFGGGNAGLSGEGWDEDYVRQVEAFLADVGGDRDRPFALVVSLVNPHDVLGYPASYEGGGYSRDEFRGMGVELPPTVDEDLSGKPTVHALMKLGQTAYLGRLRSREAELDYVNFYAYLHRLVDEKIGRIVAALGDPADPESLRSRTVVIRTSDHGEMGLAHGGLRQKMFNSYEETLSVPLVVSNPVLFPEPLETDALASHVDVLPTALALAGADAPAGLRGVDLGPVLRDRSASVRDAVHFAYDDHQAGTARANVPGQPNRIRCVRDARHKYARYLDPSGRTPPEHELYDLEEDPLEVRNLVDKATGEPLDGANADLRDRMAATLEEATAGAGTAAVR